jgi:hypothetical protein
LTRACSQSESVGCQPCNQLQHLNIQHLLCACVCVCVCVCVNIDNTWNNVSWFFASKTFTFASLSRCKLLHYAESLKMHPVKLHYSAESNFLFNSTVNLQRRTVETSIRTCFFQKRSRTVVFIPRDRSLGDFDNSVEHSRTFNTGRMIINVEIIENRTLQNNIVLLLDCLLAEFMIQFTTLNGI